MKMWLILLVGLFMSTVNCALNIPLCPKGGEPVCAKSDYEFIYFENECKLNVYSYKRLFAGKSRPTKIPLENCFSNCAGIICPGIYQPVCVQQITDGSVSTVPNACLVNQLICETRKQWIIINNGPCASPAESSQSNYDTAIPVPTSVNYASNAPSNEPAPRYQSNSDNIAIPGASSPSADTIHVSSYNVPSSNAPTYTHTINTYAKSSDKYTIAAYSSAYPASTIVANSAPASAHLYASSKAVPVAPPTGYATSNHSPQAGSSSNFYQVSSSKSQEISYTSSKESSSPGAHSSYHFPAPTPVADSSHVAYGPSALNYTSAAGSSVSAQAQGIYATSSHSPIATSTSYSNLSNPGSPSAEGSYQVEVSHPAQYSNDYQGVPVPAVPAHYENSNPTNQGLLSGGGSYQGEVSHPEPQYHNHEVVVQTAPAHYENPPTLNQGSSLAADSYQAETPHHAQNSNDHQGADHIATDHYGNSLPAYVGTPSPANSYQAEIPQPAGHYNDYQGTAHTAPAHYGNSQPLNHGSTSSTSSYQAETSHPVPHSDDYDGATQIAPTHYGSSSPVDLYQADIPQPATHSNEYQGVVQTGPDPYGNSHRTNQGAPSYQPETAYSAPQPNDYDGAAHSAPANYGNSQPSNQDSSSPAGVYQAEITQAGAPSNEYQGAVQTTPDHYGNSDPFNHGSSTSASSYQAETSHPAPQSNTYQGVAQTRSAQYEISLPSSQGSSSTVDSYQAAIPQPVAHSNEYHEAVQTATDHYENSQRLNYGSSTASGSYQAETSHPVPHTNDYQGAGQSTYGNSAPSSQENSHPSNQNSPSYQVETAYTPSPAGTYQDENPQPADHSKVYQGAAQTPPAHYDISEPLNHGSLPPTGSYQAQTSHDYQGSDHTAPAHYGNSHPSNQGSPSYQPEIAYPTPNSNDYQGAAQSAPAHYETSQPSNQDSQIAADSYQVEPSYPVQHSNDYPGAGQTAPDKSQAAGSSEGHYGSSDQYPASIAYPLSEHNDAPVLSLSIYPKGIQISAPESSPTVTAKPDAYQGTISTTEGPTSNPVNYWPTNQNPASEDSYSKAAPVSYTPPSPPCPTTEAVAYHDSNTAPLVDYAQANQESIQPAEPYSQTNDNTATNPNLSQVAGSAPSQETYSDNDNHATPAATPTPYPVSGSYSAQVAQQSQSSNEQNLVPPPAPTSSYLPASSLTINLTPAQTHGPAVNVYTIPYRYPLSTTAQLPSSTISSSNHEIPYAVAPAKPCSTQSGTGHPPLHWWPSKSFPVDTKIPPNEISEVFEPELADIVSKWIENNTPTQLTTNNGHSLGVPFYYQPSFTLIQYNASKAPHSCK